MSRTTNQDDGTHTLTANDLANVHAWTTFMMQFDADWNFVSVSGTNDDGSTGLDTGAIWSAFDTLPWFAAPYVVQLPATDVGGSDGLPVVLDLDGDGIEIVPLPASTAWFDMDGAGGREHTAWVGADDALLAIDLGPDARAGPDGVIDQTAEIVFTAWARGAASDMAALRAVFDSNANGMLDAADARFNEFRVWQDANGDGVSQGGEVASLAALGIASIDLMPSGPSHAYGDGSAVTGLSAYARTDGTSGIAADVTLAFDAYAAASPHHDLPHHDLPHHDLPHHGDLHA